MAEAIEILKKQGAVLVDPVRYSQLSPRRLQAWNFLFGGLAGGKGEGHANCSIAVKYGMKRDFNRWLATCWAHRAGEDFDRASREWNITHLRGWRHPASASPTWMFRMKWILEADRPRYEADRAKDLDALGHPRRPTAEVMKKNNFDALLFPGAASASIAAKPGYPTVIVPFAMVLNGADASVPRRALYAKTRSPMGLASTGMACSEPRLIELGYAFEQATKRRAPPPSTP